MPVNMSSDSKVSQEQLNIIKDAFNQYDPKKQGTIAIAKLGDGMQKCGINLRRDQLQQIMNDLEEDEIDLETFVLLTIAKIKEKEEAMFYKNLFRMLDKNNQGFIPSEVLRYILNGLAKEVDLTEEDIDEMINDIDQDGNGEVSFEEFLTLMTSE